MLLLHLYLIHITLNEKQNQININYIFLYLYFLSVHIVGNVYFNLVNKFPTSVIVINGDM